MEKMKIENRKAPRMFSGIIKKELISLIGFHLLDNSY